MKLSSGKPYKHIRLVPLSNIKRVIDIKEGDGKFLAEYYIIQNESLQYFSHSRNQLDAPVYQICLF